MLLTRFMPRSVPFFELLTAQNDLLQKIAFHLYAVVEKGAGAEEDLKRISLLEEEADALSRDLARELSQTFITPMDREDIHALNLAQERVADGLHSLATRIFASGAVPQRFPAQMMVRSLKGMVEDTALMLANISKKKKISAHLRTLKTRKNDCEMLLAGGLTELQEGEIASFGMVRELVFGVQLYERIERAVELVSDLADTMEQVVLKYV